MVFKSLISSVLKCLCFFLCCKSNNNYKLVHPTLNKENTKTNNQKIFLTKNVKPLQERREFPTSSYRILINTQLKDRSRKVKIKKIILK